MRVVSVVLSAALAGLAAAHVSIISPCPRFSPLGENCPAIPAGEVADTGDHAINGPISSVQLGKTMPLCRHTTPFATPAARWTAGQAVSIKFNPSAAIHSGGHCEFSMSYDGGNTFAVIHKELQYCFLGAKPSSLTNTASILEYTINLPRDLPSSDKAVFAWTWVNASGNREFYMNCVDVAITGGTSQSYTGSKMVIANYPGYPTIPEFNGDYNTGMEHYTGAPNVTVSPGGTHNLAPPPSAAYGTSQASAAAPSDTTSSASDSAQDAPSLSYGGAPSASSDTGSIVPPAGDYNAPPAAGTTSSLSGASSSTAGAPAAPPATDYNAMPPTESAPTFMPNDYTAAGAPAVTSSAPAAMDYTAPTTASAAYD
ncbi:hypothetical protein H4R19_004504 [Coemansia spiralis]|nr:hypothetical protein H4R19_004504 [Coemansia spiralis]